MFSCNQISSFGREVSEGGVYSVCRSGWSSLACLLFLQILFSMQSTFFLLGRWERGGCHWSVHWSRGFGCDFLHDRHLSQASFHSQLAHFARPFSKWSWESSLLQPALIQWLITMHPSVSCPMYYWVFCLLTRFFWHRTIKHVAESWGDFARRLGSARRGAWAKGVAFTVKAGFFTKLGNRSNSSSSLESDCFCQEIVPKRGLRCLEADRLPNYLAWLRHHAPRSEISVLH